MTDHPPNRGSPGSNQMAQQARAWTVALNIVYGTIAFGVVGFAVDYFTNTTPWGLVTGLILGLVVGTYRFIREAMALSAAAPGRPPRSGPPATREPESKNGP